MKTWKQKIKKFKNKVLPRIEKRETPREIRDVEFPEQNPRPAPLEPYDGDDKRGPLEEGNPSADQPEK